MYKNYYGIKFRNPFAPETEGCSDYYCAEMLINALALYVVSNRPECEHTDESIYKMLTEREGVFNDPVLSSAFKKLEYKNPCALELAYYKVFISFPYKQQSSIIATLIASNFDIKKKMLLNK